MYLRREEEEKDYQRRRLYLGLGLREAEVRDPAVQSPPTASQPSLRPAHDGGGGGHSAGQHLLQDPGEPRHGLPEQERHQAEHHPSPWDDE